MRYTLLLPDSSRDVASLLKRGEVSTAIAELRHRAALGSQSAKTVLAYLHLQGAFTGQADYEQATALLQAPVAAGNPYALYVMGWIHFLRDKNAKPAVQHWISGANQGFTPSLVEIGRFLSWDLPDKPPNLEAAVDKLLLAHHLGHKQAPCLVAVLDAKGARGVLYALSAPVRWVYFFLRFVVWLHIDMFSEQVFLRPPSQKKPFFDMKELPQDS
jgi:TPR repeat protein